MHYNSGKLTISECLYKLQQLTGQVSKQQEGEYWKDFYSRCTIVFGQLFSTEILPKTKILVWNWDLDLLTRRWVETKNTVKQYYSFSTNFMRRAINFVTKKDLFSVKIRAFRAKSDNHKDRKTTVHPLYSYYSHFVLVILLTWTETKARPECASENQFKNPITERSKRPEGWKCE